MKGMGILIVMDLRALPGFSGSAQTSWDLPLPLTIAHPQSQVGPQYVGLGLPLVLLSCPASWRGL